MNLLKNMLSFGTAKITPTSNDTTVDIAKSGRKRKVNALDIWALGITIVIGGQYFAWNVGLTAGFGSYLIVTLMIAMAYTCLMLSISEISSGLPFAGGSYGLARVSLGFYVGFIIGCSEAIEYIVYTSTTCITLGAMIATLFNIEEIYHPLIWFLFYASSLYIHCRGGRLFWDFNMFLAIVSIGILLVYCFGSLQYVDFNRYTSQVNVDDTNQDTSYFVGGGMAFMAVFRLSSWFFVGVESLPFACDAVEQPKKAIPLGAVSCVLTLFATCIMVYFICCSMPVGEVSQAASTDPFSYGFSLMFGITEKTALALSIPATYATAFGFIFPYGKLLQGLGNSNLIPTPFQWTTKETGTPYFSILAGSFIGYLICLLVYFFPKVNLYLFDVCILSGFITNVSQCIGYLAMSTKFQSINREFHSPFGKYGAIYAMCVYTMGILSVIAFQADQVALIVFVVLVTLLTIYYYAYAKHHQTFSPEESKIMFVAHVITFNKNGKKTRKRNSIQTVSAQARNTNASENVSMSRMVSMGASGKKAFESIGYTLAMSWLRYFPFLSRSKSSLSNSHMNPSQHSSVASTHVKTSQKNKRLDGVRELVASDDDDPEVVQE